MTAIRFSPKSQIKLCEYGVPMMEAIAKNEMDDSQILRKINLLREKLNDLYNQKGPACSDYITLGLELNMLIKQYLALKCPAE